MASVPELRQMCEELSIDSQDLLIDEMKQMIRTKFDEIYKSSKMLGTSMFSKTLVRFITKEYDYLLRNKQGERKEWTDLNE